jgi:hypothetical protein
MVRALKFLPLFASRPISLFDELFDGEQTVEHCRAGDICVSWSKKLRDFISELVAYLFRVSKWIKSEGSENDVSALSCQVVNEYPVSPVVLDLSPLSPWPHWKAS